MSSPETEPKVKPPPEINCSESITLISEENRPEQYHQFEEESALAIRAALGAKRPLLVRGKPGVGKTQLAAAAAKVLKRPLVSRVVDSRTEARDLLWEFDAVMRLAEAQIAAALAPVFDSQNRNQEGHQRDISQDRRNVVKQLRRRLSVHRFLRPGPLWWAFDWKSALKQALRSGSPIPDWLRMAMNKLTDLKQALRSGSPVLALDPEANPENGCVVLIDEIDKADADVPNGLLEALGSGEFTPLGTTKPIKVAGEPPLVIITTNEERVLPNAFVRRCLVLRLKLPDRDDELIDFLKARGHVHFPRQAKSGNYDSLFHEAAKLLVRDRTEARERFVEPLPGQAEYLDLLRAVLHLKPDVVEYHQKFLDSVAEFTLRKHEKPQS
jgi:MoxR-like ATPase